MHVGASPTHTVAHTVNRLLIDTDAAFDDVRRRYESLVPTIDFAEFTALVNAGDLSEVKQYTAEHALHTFVNFWTFDPTPMMQLFGHRTRAMTYMMGNNVIVESFATIPGSCVVFALPTYVWVIVLGGRAGILHSGQLHMQVNRGGVVRPLARVHE